MPDHHWIAGRLALTTPDWRPDPVRARAAMDAAMSPRRRPVLRFAAATAVALVAVAVVLPSGRAAAQELWYRLFVSRVEVVRLDLSRVPLDTSIRTTGAEQAAQTVGEASGLAGYTVHLPPADVLPGTPVLAVLRPIEVTQTIRTAPLAAALAAVGAGDLEVPAEWDGVAVRATIGPTVVARYLGSSAIGRHPDDVEIVQTPAVRLELPASFAVAQFAEVVFRAGGLPWWDARRLAAEYAANPAWLLDVARSEAVTVETVPLAGGTAIVMEDASDASASRTTVIVSRPWRLYSVSSPNRDTSLRVANALP